MTYYLKYRPKNIDELDSLAAKKLLSEILASKTLPHALLFTGPRGIGKTSSARIVAKVINCSQKTGITPCDKCDLCLSIAKGSCVDVVEMDAASHRGIEDAKELIAGIKLVPSLAPKKVYIIDEAHMLTTEASNVLLKTLEEPPSHVVFILATTNREKIIPTILSRVVEVQFGLATKDELVSALNRIVAGEKLEVPPETLHLVAEKARGSFRDATKLLEQLVISNSLNLEEAITALNGRDFGKTLDNLILAINHKEALSAIQTLEEALANGLALGDLMTSFLDKLMQGLLMKTTPFDKLNRAETLALADLLLTASAKAKDALLEQVPYEIALVKWADEYPQKREWQSLKETIKKTPIKTNIGLAKKILLQ